MTSIQSTLSFPVKKKPSFYGNKSKIVEQDFTLATVTNTPSRYIPTVKKLVTLSSSESDSDSDVENVIKESNKTIRKGRNHVISTPKSTRKFSESEDEHGSSPPKQRKTFNQLSNNLSPSTLLNKLNLEGLDDKLSPKCLFPSENKYQCARKALHSSAPEHLPGREKELEELEEFIREHLLAESSASLYVSGPPGTGKTASLSKIMLMPEFKEKFNVVYVNCTTMKSAAAIYGRIISELNIKSKGRNNKQIIEKYLISKHKMILLVLDEIDQLESRNQTVLYSIFEWPSISNSKLLLIGIANALDLTDRVLPRLQARCELKPKLMHFAPYTKQQIFNIISTRLNEANVSEVFTTNAIQMLAGKVAAISGDIRKALDISRRVVELAESQKTIQILQPTNTNDVNTSSPKKQSTAADKAVDLKEVVTVLSSVYGGSQNLNKEESTFPLQQKLLLCSLMLILNKGRNKDVTVGRLHEVYKKVCKKRNIHALDISEFVSLCSLIETQGVVAVIRKREPRLSKIGLQWDQEELDAALQDKNMLAEIMSDTTCL